MRDIKCRTFRVFFILAGGVEGLLFFCEFIYLSGGSPKTHRLLYYCLCKHVIFLSNEPYTGSVMKQLALTRAK